MLGQRVVTALVLLAILVASIFLAPPWVWGAVSLALLAVACHEWGRLLGEPAGGNALGVALAAAGAAYIAWRTAHPEAAPPAAVVAIAGASIAFWLTAGPASLWRVARLGPGWPIGALTLAACWLALYELRLAGAALLVSCMAIVWLADIGAYFAGRRFGRHKLAPRVSPGKTWEGVAGGVVAVLAAAAIAAATLPAGPDSPVFSSWVAARAGWAAAVAVLAALAALSVVGDLYESLLKRLAGVKDSGSILPGHGGVLDRIDALIPTMPGCLLLLQLLR